MATMLFGAVGSAVGGSFGGSVASLAGGVGLGFLGRLFGRKKKQDTSVKVTFGQRVEDVYLTGSAENAAIRKLWGRMRLGGNVIWCSNFREWQENVVTFSPSASSGKGLGGSSGTSYTPSVTVVYHYNISFAVAFCEGGPGASLGRVWADGKELNLAGFTWRFYDGSETQTPDPLIESIEGAGNVPAYRGMCYIVFEDMLLDKFGNRMPQITAEIIRRPIVDDRDDLSNSLRSVCMIPGSGEFIYGTTVVKASYGTGSWKPENANVEDGRADVLISLDQLCGLNQSAAAIGSGGLIGTPTPPTPFTQDGGYVVSFPLGANAPTGGNWKSGKGALNACDAVSLVVTWFGTDLRAGNCQIVPKVEVAAKNNAPSEWGVAGYNRNGTAWFVILPFFPWLLGPVAYGTPGAVPLAYGTAAQTVSQVDASTLDPSGMGAGVAFGGGLVPAFGGTPSDATVVEAIREIKRRGLRCVFYPFVQMDIPPGNTLPNPYSANASSVGQAAFPWRGRITCSPAPGYAGTVDKTSAAATQIDAFFSQYTTMVTHYANLCVTAGGVDAFIIGSELVGLTQVRSGPGDATYPAVTHLKTLAASVRAILGAGPKIGYAADWSEYHSHRPSDGSNDVIFNLDPLWSDPNIDFIGVDNYLPVSDWRDLGSNIDADPVNGPLTIYDQAYLQSNIEGGEYFDWHYASAADRTSQVRTPIADTAYSLSASSVFAATLLPNGTAAAYSLRSVVVPSSGGSMCRVTIKVGAGVTVSHVAIGVRSTGPNTTATPVELLFGGAAGFTADTSGVATSDWATFSFTLSDQLVVIVDTPSFPVGYIVGAPAVTAYYKASASSYNDPAPSGFSELVTWLFGVAAIEVGNLGYFNEHWAFRNKDLRNWWLEAHHSRPAGARNAAATAFAPGSKPIWFTEFGCPAVDKGTNQPNVFIDPKSSESAYPHFSTGSRDDAIQRAYLEAMLSYWRDHAPVSGAGVRMIEPRNMFAWCWDARPFPDFPAQGATWRDNANYELGHWLTGRLTEVPLKWIVAELCASVGVVDFDTRRLIGPDSLVLGAAADGVMSPRDMLAQIDDVYQFDAYETMGALSFAWRGEATTIAVTLDDLVMDGGDDIGYSLTRAQETDLPDALQISFIDPYNNYAQSSTSARRRGGNSNNVSSVSTPTIVSPGRARVLARSLLQQEWAGRESGRIKLAPSKAAAIDPGDCVALTIAGGALTMRVNRIETGTYRTLELAGFDPSLARVGAAPGDGSSIHVQPPVETHGAPIVEFLDIPMAIGDEPSPFALRVAAFASPWSGVSVYRSLSGSNTLVATINSPTPMGELTAPLYSGVRSLWDMGNAVYVQFYGDTHLLSASDAEVFDGANAVAIKNGANGQWEILQFATADLIGPNKYKLSKLLRAQLGTEAGMADPIATGGRVVVLNAATLAVLNMSVGQIGQTLTLRAGPSNYDPGDASYFDYSVTPAGVGLRPWSVSQISGARASGSNDVTFGWVRRTRFGGDAWDPPDVPLNEQSESYDVEVMNGAAVVRAVSGLTAPSFVYTAAMQTADFGSAQSSYTLRIYQNSAQIGRGQIATKTVTF